MISCAYNTGQECLHFEGYMNYENLKICSTQCFDARTLSTYIHSFSLKATVAVGSIGDS